VFENLRHLFKLPMRREADWVLVPLKVHDVGVESDRVVGGIQVIWKVTFAAG
jgi:hypothetical protein